MGSYASVAVRDSAGNIVGYISTSTGQVVETTGAGSLAFQQAQAQYAQQRYTSVDTGGSYRQSIQYAYIPSNIQYEKSAAGIALEVQQRGSGGIVTESLAAKAAAQGYAGPLSSVEGRSTVPIRDLSSAASDTGMAGEMTTVGGRTFYVPYGERTQQEITDAKAVYDPVGGRVGIYQVPRSIYESEGGFKRRYAIESASGSTGALQSGMFSIDKPLTPDVRTQWASEKYAKSADITRAEQVRAAPAEYSRMGAEAYGGTVTRLDARTLAPGAQMGRYPVATGNLANLVDPLGGNRPKAELQATEPWQIRADSPALQTMSGAGFGGTTLAPAGMSEYAKVGVSDRVVGRGKVAGFGKTTYTEEGLPKTFVSTSIQGSPTVEQTIRPSDIDLFAMQLNIPYVSEGIVGASDFFIGGRTIEERVVGTPTTKTIETPEGIVTETTTPITTISTPVPSGFEYGERRFAAQISEKFLPTVTLPRTGTTADYNIALVEGAYAGIREKPLTSAVYFGAGIGLAAVGEVVVGAGAAATVATAGTRAAPVVAGMNIFATKVAPAALTAIYTYDVAERSTKGFQDYSIESTRRLGYIGSTEVVPMIAGGSVFALRAPIAREVVKGGVALSREFAPTVRSVKQGGIAFAAQQRVMGIENIGVRGGVGAARIAEPAKYTGPASEYPRGGDVGLFLDTTPAGWFKTVPKAEPRIVTDEMRYAAMEMQFTQSKYPLLETTKQVTVQPVWQTIRTTTTQVKFDPLEVAITQREPAGRFTGLAFEREGMGGFGGVEAWTTAPTGTKTAIRRERLTIDPYSGQVTISGRKRTTFTPREIKPITEMYEGTFNLYELPPSVAIAGEGVRPTPPVGAIVKATFESKEGKIGGERFAKGVGELYKEGGGSFQIEPETGIVTPFRETRKTSEFNKAITEMLEAPSPELGGIGGYAKAKSGVKKVTRVKAPGFQPSVGTPVSATISTKEFVRPTRPGSPLVFFEPTLEERASSRIASMFGELAAKPKPTMKSRELVMLEAKIAQQRTREENVAKFSKGFVSEPQSLKLVSVYTQPKITTPMPKSATTVITPLQQRQRVATTQEIENMIRPTKRVATESEILEMVAPRQRAATPKEIENLIRPRQYPIRYEETVGKAEQKSQTSYGIVGVKTISGVVMKRTTRQVTKTESIVRPEDYMRRYPGTTEDVGRTRDVVPAVRIGRDPFVTTAPITDTATLPGSPPPPPPITEWKPPTEPKKPTPPVPPVAGIVWLPPIGGSSTAGHGYRGKYSKTFVNPVGADILGATRGQKISIPKGKKFKAPKFRMPKF